MATKSEVLHNIIKNLKMELSEVENVAIVATDGTTFATSTKDDEEATKVGAIIATVIGLSKKACNTLDRGLPQEALIKGENGYIALYPAGDNSALGITALPDINLGMLNLECRNAAKKIEKVLS